MTKNFLLVCALVSLSACAGPQVSRVQPLSADADSPYENILVVSLFESFDMRRYLEQEIVGKLEDRGIQAVASTSRMDTRTPVTRQTFLDMVEATGADAVLVTQLVDLETEAKMKNMRAESTYNVRPTYYYNVWSVELTEYREPPTLNLKHTIVLATQLYSAAQKQPVWAIESESRVTQDFDMRGDFSVIIEEANAITSYLSRDGLLAP